jgi:DNA-binding phage protein
MRCLPFPDLIRGLVLQSGFPATHLSGLAGVSPGTITAMSERLPSPLDTWMRLIAAFGARLIVKRGGDTWQVQLPTTAKQVFAREQRAWRAKRYASYLHAIAAQNPGLKRTEREARAKQYAQHEESRLIAELPAVRERMRQVLVDGECAGLRHALQQMARAANLKTDELSWISGVGPGAIDAAIAAADDGRLLPTRQVLAALGATIEIQLPSRRCLVIARPPEVMSAAAVVAQTDRKRSPPARSETVRPLRQSTLPRDEILRLYDRGIPITTIAEQAGISRQRVHALAKASGRHLRRQQQRTARSHAGRRLLLG